MAETAIAKKIVELGMRRQGRRRDEMGLTACSGPHKAASDVSPALADKRLGLPINFHVALVTDGIARIVNRLEEDVHGIKPSR